jgi:uncharacterized membrane protein YhaH (DUF805 family)
MKILQKPFSTEGRIGRVEYIITLLIFFAVGEVAKYIAGLFQSEIAQVLLVLVFSPIIWFFFSQSAKRCHDMGNSGFFILIPFYFLLMIFARGDNDNNQYGSAT